MPRDNIVILHRGIAEQPRDYAGPCFVPSPERKLSLLERMVIFFRDQQFRIGIACYIVAVATACYFAVQIGRGL